VIQKFKNFEILKFARAISYIFDGSVLVIPVFLATCFYRRQNPAAIVPSFLTAIVFTALIPYMTVLLLYKAGKISNLQIPKRKERLFPLLVINICLITGFFVLIYYTQPEKLLLSVYTIYLLALPVISLITLFWKISFHASYITLFSIVYLIVLGKWAIFTIPLIPLIGWSRIKLKKHTLSQVLGGIAVIGVISLTVFYLTGYLTTSYWAISELSRLLISSSNYMDLVLPGFGLSLIFILVYVIIQKYFNGKKERVRDFE
jgi:membrane-associated phospholipid phosphatase